MKVLVLGCGPAGLMAAHAASLDNHDVMIVSKARKSYMRGAQYLHEPIPFATKGGRSFEIQYSLIGTADQYREKVYGPKYTGTVSPEELTSSHRAYDIRQTYDWLWDTYGKYVLDDDLDKPGHIGRLMNWASADLVISTIPAPILCLQDGQVGDNHRFQAEHIWSVSGVDAEVVWGMPNNKVVCNGEDVPRWYRAAKIMGHETIEWPYDLRPPIEGIFDVTKPISTTCTCWPEIVRMGRYGKWQKGVLSHTAFYETANLLAQPHQLRLDID